MAEFQQSSKQSEARIDPAARQGMRRFLADMESDQLSAFIRDCLRAVDRKAAVAIFNDDVLGLPIPTSSDRGRISTVLRGVLRAGRPDGFECLQDLTSHHLEKSLDDDQYEIYSEAVDALNEAAEAGDSKKITAAAKQVVEAMRAGMDDAAIGRYVKVHALPETVDALIDAASGKRAAAGDDAGAKPATTKKTAAKKTAAKKTAAKKTAAKKTTAKKTTAKKPAAKKATTKKGGGKQGSVRKTSRRSGG